MIGRRNPHDIDILTSFCLSCGQSAEHILDVDLPCAGAPNVIPISHIVAGRRVGQFLRGSAFTPADIAGLIFWAAAVDGPRGYELRAIVDRRDAYGASIGIYQA